jgi:hypothetical protein
MKPEGSLPRLHVDSISSWELRKFFDGVIGRLHLRSHITLAHTLNISCNLLINAHSLCVALLLNALDTP